MNGSILAYNTTMQSSMVNSDDENLRDVFCSSLGSTSLGNDEYSDLPRLKSMHETAGYRDGISKGKEECVQRGFDEGFGLGAIIGLRVGMILGLLEGVSKGAQVAYREAKRAKQMWQAAENELSTRNIFGIEWWSEHGVWLYEVQGDIESEEVTFIHVAKAHPLLKKWEKIVQDEVQKWQIDLKIFDRDQSALNMHIPTDQMAKRGSKGWDMRNTRAADDLEPIKDNLNW
ncbi:Uncharacterized protein yae1 [Golovinomyces cichoracearum]|uniref:Protein YAE1 n=1 Tax=Golovinomyces cichoracearum TaxID=62708 RepID=A0A420IHK7_9PEZI|nr:Uncharacterized protein yae1 [Golovinomyces cichoracearum]